MNSSFNKTVNLYNPKAKTSKQIYQRAMYHDAALRALLKLLPRIQRISRTNVALKNPINATHREAALRVVVSVAHARNM